MLMHVQNGAPCQSCQLFAQLPFVTTFCPQRPKTRRLELAAPFGSLRRDCRPAEGCGTSRNSKIMGRDLFSRARRLLAVLLVVKTFQGHLLGKEQNCVRA